MPPAAISPESSFASFAVAGRLAAEQREWSAREIGALRDQLVEVVRTTLAEIRSRGITFDYVITNAETGERFVTARTTLVSIDLTGKLVALPQGIRALFETTT